MGPDDGSLDVSCTHTHTHARTLARTHARTHAPRTHAPRTHHARTGEKERDARREWDREWGERKSEGGRREVTEATVKEIQVDE